MNAPLDPTTAQQAQHRFLEVQVFPRWPFVGVIAITSTILVIGSVGHATPMPWVETLLLGLFGICGPLALFLVLRLTTTVTHDTLVLRFPPFVHRRIPLSDIAIAEATTYRPLLEYGGWGIRLGFGGWCYNVRGNEGVRVTLRDGRRIMIGSGRASELARALGAPSRG
jgi:hypothetical protein